jgi:hypothetical protein
MNCSSRHLRLASVFLLVCFGLPSAAWADGPHERTQFGHDINIGPNEESGELTCFGCSVRVRGRVSSDVTVFAGSVVVEDQGQIGGDTAVFGGGVRLDKNVKLGGDVTVFGGKIRRDPTASVGGDVTNFAGSIWIFLVFGLPCVVLGMLVALVVWVVRRLLRPAASAATA